MTYLRLMLFFNIVILRYACFQGIQRLLFRMHSFSSSSWIRFALLGVSEILLGVGAGAGFLKGVVLIRTTTLSNARTTKTFAMFKVFVPVIDSDLLV